MMSFGDSSYSLSISFFWLHVHWVFLGLAVFGFLAALVFLIKHASKTTVRSTMTWALILGIVGLLFTAPWAARGAFSMMGMMQGGTYDWDEGTWSSWNEEGFQENMIDYMEEEWDEIESKYGEDPSMQDMMDYMQGEEWEDEEAVEEESSTTDSEGSF